ncbi:MAG: VWA domain-containing protein [Terriglobales bacterium]
MPIARKTRLHALWLLGAILPLAHAPDAATPDVPTFTSTTRIVLVDVVATDSHGESVYDLKANDFSVLDNGKPQEIVAFEAHRADAAPKPPPALNLPENVYTNYVPRSDPGALTVLLFDSLNTSPQDLIYARQRMLIFLERLPPGTRLALYTLGSELRMVHSFTENSDELIEAAKELTSHPNSTYPNAKEFSAEIDDLKHSGLSKVPVALQKMIRFLGEEYEGKQERRAEDTLDVFTQLAHALSVVPGRKNLIWISSAFPLDSSSDDRRLQRVAALLAVNRIAVYPVDARGVVVMGPDAQASGSEAYSERSEDFSGQDQENADIIETVQSIAEMTGGRAHFNNNDLEGAMANSMCTGSNYYTLAYRPAGVEWDGHFSKIAIKTARPHIRLLYRSGYYAIADPSNSNDDPHRVVALAMQPNVPVSTQFIMKARVIPPETTAESTKVDIFIDVHDLVLAEANIQKTLVLDFFAVAWDASGKEGGHFAQEFHAVSQAQYESLLRTGLQVHQDMPLKPGLYQLRLGVMDRRSGRIGTLDVPLRVGKGVTTK